MNRKNALTQWLLSTTALAMIVFLCAGKTDSPMLWAYLATIVGLNLVATLVLDPALLEERGSPENKVLDSFVGSGTTVLFLLTVAIAALDSGRFHWSIGIGRPAQAAALAFLATMTSLQIWAMTVNPFFSTEIRLQIERGHHLVTRGPYRFVRHPGYFGMIFAMPATAIALGSWLALFPALFYSAVILGRTVREDTFLKNKLPGYVVYSSHIRYRLFLAIW